MNNKNRFVDLLEQKKILLFDGGMGTLLYNKGVYINRCYDELNLSTPGLVSECHAAYVDAGADVIETNTFGANRVKLKAHGFEDKLKQINISGAELARKAAGESVLVAGSVGPLDIMIEPWGPTSEEEARDFFREQIQVLVDGGVDLIILETFGNLNEIHQALNAAREVSGLPVIAQMTIREDGNSPYSTQSEVFTSKLDEWGADIIGVNCGVGPEISLEVLEKMIKVTSKPLSVQPNAGMPRNVEGRNIYLASSEYFGEYTKRFIQSGARIVGGCCGTTPEHIKSMRRAIQAITPRSQTEQTELVQIPARKEEGIRETSLDQRSRMAAFIRRGEFVVCIELVPPRGSNVEKILERANALKERGILFINIPDGPRASARMSPLALAVKIRNEVGIEPLLHYACRDRNLLGMQSDILGAAALGIRNILAVTGDPPKLGDYPDATAVFDVDSIGLTNMLTQLNRGLDIGSNELKSRTSFLIGVGVNPGAIDLEHELHRFYWKVEAGAHFAITQPVFDVSLLEYFLNTIEQRNMKIPVIAGIWPLLSLRNAQFMNNEVPGATVPEPIMERMARAESGEEARHIGVSIAREILERIRPMIQGAQISPPLGRIELALNVLE